MCRSRRFVGRGAGPAAAGLAVAVNPQERRHAWRSGSDARDPAPRRAERPAVENPFQQPAETADITAPPQHGQGKPASNRPRMRRFGINSRRANEDFPQTAQMMAFFQRPGRAELLREAASDPDQSRIAHLPTLTRCRERFRMLLPGSSPLYLGPVMPRGRRPRHSRPPQMPARCPPDRQLPRQDPMVRQGRRDCA